LSWFFQLSEAFEKVVNTGQEAVEVSEAVITAKLDRIFG
jgi:hypothetical protein